MFTTENCDNARRYVNRLRNNNKREYAALYLFWLVFNPADDPPHIPHGLSYMAAQAVRMKLTDFKAKEE
ncbi:hypothetical protein LCGC14_1321930 [marine sediment metagenome]|uniref:Uncharacterized protein n=1 Tax=marine sediment metagenome TaxID=412755 RepID=A0A0F9KJS1_9ZZZZ